MNGLPAYHPEWLITFWFSAPGLNKLDPHITIATIGLIIIVIYFTKNFKRPVEQVIDGEEELFQQLLTKKKVIQQQLNELKSNYELQSMTLEEFQVKQSEYKKLLEQTRQKLRDFT